MGREIRIMTPAPGRQCLILLAAAVWTGAVSADSVVPLGPRLKDIVPRGGPVPFLIGATIKGDGIGTVSETVFVREFDFLTPANDFKQAQIHPEPDVWRWQKADALVDYARQRGLVMRLHAPVSPQCSAWAMDDSRTPEELLQNMEEYVTAIASRYADQPHVQWMDVVNETVTDKGEWFGPREGVGKWENPWPRIGVDESTDLRPPLYIRRAFELATEHGGHLRLIINQHGGMQPAMWDRVKRTVGYLRAAGLRVDGIGWQAHVDAQWEKDPANVARLDDLIRWCHDNDLEFHVTENTVWMRRKESTAEAQAATFAAIVRTVAAHRHTGVVSWNLWQVRDADLQRPEFKGCMFDDEGGPRPAYYAVQRELQSLRESTP